MRTRYIKNGEGRITFYFPEWKDLPRNPEFVYVLLLNMMPLLGVLLWNWNAREVLLLYFLESIVIGIFNTLYMGFASNAGEVKDMSGEQMYNGQPGELKKAKRFNIPFFLVHYGFFIAIQAWFVFPAVFPKDESVIDLLFSLMAHDLEFQLTVLGMILGQLIQFTRGYVASGDYKTATVTEYFFKPYTRIFLQQVLAIIGTGIALVSGGYAAIAVVVLLVLLRTSLDTILIFNQNLLSTVPEKKQYWEWKELPAEEWDPEYWPPKEQSGG